MPASIGVNLRVTGHCSQGGRKYMEDLFSVAYQKTEDERDLEYAFFGIYDGHGGSEAAAFAKEHLMDSIVKQRQFWSDDDEDVLKAIRNGYMLTHLNMWKEIEKWPKTVTGLPSTAGTTASVAFIRRGKIYIGHVGDSAIVLGYQKEGSDDWVAKPLTLDHKPESTTEMERIQQSGGKVVSKAGVPRVVWNRPRPGHKGPIKKDTPMDEIPFLAVARSLGDLWSYNVHNDEFIVSPDPDVGVLTIDPTKFRCLIFGTDGLWNMISPEGAVTLVQATEKHNEAALVGGSPGQSRDWLNPSKSLVDHALERWSNTRMRADNTSVVTLMLDPPGPPRATVLRSRTAERPPAPVPDPAPATGLTIMTRYSDTERTNPQTATPAAPPTAPPTAPAAVPPTPLPPCAELNTRFSIPPPDSPPDSNVYGNPAESYFMTRLLNRSRIVNVLSAVCEELTGPRPVTPTSANTSLAEETVPESTDDVTVQVNEVSSSSPPEAPKGRTRRTKAESKEKPPNPPVRVLRSHETETRRQTRRPPVVPTDRVVIVSRTRSGDAAVTRVTRSKDTAPGTIPGNTAPAVRKCPRAPGNWRGAEGRARQPPPAPDCSKENRKSKRRAAPSAPSPPRPRRPRTDDEVHSTTSECRLTPVPPPPRALRSRNEPLPVVGTIRRSIKARLARRESGPWAPALALRNRLRKRLTK